MQPRIVSERAPVPAPSDGRRRATDARRDADAGREILSARLVLCGLRVQWRDGWHVLRQSLEGVRQQRGLRRHMLDGDQPERLRIGMRTGIVLDVDHQSVLSGQPVSAWRDVQYGLAVLHMPLRCGPLRNR